MDGIAWRKVNTGEVSREISDSEVKAWAARKELLFSAVAIAEKTAKVITGARVIGDTAMIKHSRVSKKQSKGRKEREKRK